jgi:NAD(P)-dependent dehydrogenase (short-subunit alcohol dehydrogenase family)
MARALVAAGVRVALADIDAARLADVARELTDAGGTVLPVELDVADAEQWSAAADRAEDALGPISILCNNAGVNGGGLIDQTPVEVWRWVFAINVEAQFIGVSTFLPRFKSRGGRAHIVNTASMAGIVPMIRVAAYSASKFASVGFSMVLRDELADTDIGVSMLCPGTVASRINVTAGEGEAKLLGQEVNTAVVEGNGALLAHGADPNQVGAQVVEAMRDGQFLIITHGDWEPLVARVHSEIEQAFGEFDNRHGPDLTVQILAQGISPVTT